jgi:hypothetical protein
MSFVCYQKKKDRLCSASSHHDYIFLFFSLYPSFRSVSWLYHERQIDFLLCLFFYSSFFFTQFYDYYYSDTISVVLVVLPILSSYNCHHYSLHRAKLVGLITFSVTCTHVHMHFLLLVMPLQLTSSTNRNNDRKIVACGCAYLLLTGQHVPDKRKQRDRTSYRRKINTLPCFLLTLCLFFLLNII